MSSISADKTALIVSYVFPPMAAVGGQRVVNFCKFLPHYGWTPVVLTVKNGVNTSWDPAPLKIIPETIIYRALTFEPVLRREIAQFTKKEAYIPKAETQSVNSNIEFKLSLLRRIKRFLRLFLTVPDHAIFWIPFGVLKGLKAIRREKISVIMSSSPPVSAHIVASILSRLTGIPHLLDFRDLWTLNQNYDLRNYPPIFKRYDKFWEQFVLKHASNIMTATPGCTQELEGYLKGSIRGRLVTITNGFDYNEIDLSKEFVAPEKDKFRILYTGSLYSQFNPVFFLEGLSLWINSNPHIEPKVQVDFYGNYDYDYNGYVEKLGLGKVVTFHKYINRRELLPLFTMADYLLLLIGFRPQARSVMPAKMYEYLASGVKILALSPEGPAVEWIKKYDAGVFICEPDQKMMVNLLQTIYDDWLKTPRRPIKYRYIEEIDRAKLTGRLAQLLNETAGLRG
jgi:glycosyltransferase involved in cell wall biosynthesis